MSDVPADPRALLEEYLPAEAAARAEQLRGVTSVGSLVFRVPEVGIWSVRLVDGSLETSRGMDDDALLQITIPAVDFEPLIVETIRRAAARGGSARQGALKSLTLDPRTARGLRHMPGSVLFVVTSDGVERRALLTPGLGKTDPERADCTVSCTMEDYVAMQTGAVQPLQLFANGRLKLSGNVQLALALSGIFA